MVTDRLLGSVPWFRVCVLETDSEIGVEKISLTNDFFTKSLDLICLAISIGDYSANIDISYAI